MLEFHVEDMTCGHCAGAITKAVQQAVPQATVQVDLDSHTVRVQGAPDAQAVAAAISEAGYTPTASS